MNDDQKTGEAAPPVRTRSRNIRPPGREGCQESVAAERKYAKVFARAKAFKEQRPVHFAPVESAKNFQIIIWPEAVRGVPNSVLRSAIFGAVKRGKRAFMQRIPLAAVDGVNVLFTGPRLDQSDLDVWEQCMHLARTGGLGTRIQFAAHGFLKTIGRSTGKSQHEWLRNVFARLASSVVEIKDGKRAYFGPMIHHGTRDDESGHYCIEINPAIATLYGKDGWSQVEWGERQALKRQPLAQWLHGFYTTHAKPYAYRVESIHELCGSEARQMFHFRAELRAALENLEAVTGWTWKIDDTDLVQIQKKPTGSQSRHLVRKQLKARHSADGDTAQRRWWHGIAQMVARHSADGGTA